MNDMTGKEHFEEAERLLEHAGDPMMAPDRAQVLIGRAQVHAQLAVIRAQLVIATTGIPAPIAESIFSNWETDS